MAGSIDWDIVNPLDMHGHRKVAINARRTYSDRAGDSLSFGYACLSQPNATVQRHGDTPGQERNVYPLTGAHMP